MKSIKIFIILFYVTGCRNEILKHPQSSIVIAIQPLNNFEKGTLEYLSSEIHKFYSCRAIILSTKDIPGQFFDDTKSPRYSADSLIRYLKLISSDTFDYVLGVTHRDIFTTKKMSTATSKVRQKNINYGEYVDWVASPVRVV